MDCGNRIGHRLKLCNAAEPNLLWLDFAGRFSQLPESNRLRQHWKQTAA